MVAIPHPSLFICSIVQTIYVYVLCVANIITHRSLMSTNYIIVLDHSIQTPKMSSIFHGMSYTYTQFKSNAADYMCNVYTICTALWRFQIPRATSPHQSSLIQYEIVYLYTSYDAVLCWLTGRSAAGMNSPHLQ